MEKIMLLLVLAILVTGCARQAYEGYEGAYEGATAAKEQDKAWADNISMTGTGSCMERGECEKMLGKGAFCSYGKCFPAPEDYVEGIAVCICPDGTKIRTKDCRWADCPGALTTPTEFTVKDGVVPKATIEVNLPLSGNEAKKVAMAACGISAKTSEPPSPYENVIPECSPAWSFVDETNPCNNTQAYVCGNKTFASCIFGGQTAGFGAQAIGAFCIDGLLVVQGEYQEKFIVANPLDLSQVEKFSRFRSCLGHDYSGYNEKGELETQRSMKQGGVALRGVTKMNIYAPFNGTIIKYFEPPGAHEGNEEHAAEIRGDRSGKWFITFGHFTAKEGLGFGSKVTAGEFIGTSSIENELVGIDGVEVGLDQDASTETKKEQFVRGSLLDYMADDVLAEYASYGLTPENVVYTKEYRDAHPCNWNAIGANPDDFVTLKHN